MKLKSSKCKKNDCKDCGWKTLCNILNKYPIYKERGLKYKNKQRTTQIQ